ncbi:MAG: hypothetical protein Q8859_06460 [Bacteroidota bacterium]|nr:hypothetical protein [Bacteroidota bacterium]
MKKINDISKFTVWIIAILLILLGLIYSISHTVKTKYSDFHKLDIDSVNQIVLYEFKFKGRCDSIILSENQCKRFIINWNYSFPVGPCKFIPKYTLCVKMKNGQSRSLRINGRVIKEQNDFGYEFLLGDRFYESIWNGRDKDLPASQSNKCCKQ